MSSPPSRQSCVMRAVETVKTRMLQAINDQRTGKISGKEANAIAAALNKELRALRTRLHVQSK
jgi:2,3-bisphosphoglycerate-independent phosphoglycerate mutase